MERLRDLNLHGSLRFFWKTLSAPHKCHSFVQPHHSCDTKDVILTRHNTFSAHPTISTTTTRQHHVDIQAPGSAQSKLRADTARSSSPRIQKSQAIRTRS